MRTFALSSLLVGGAVASMVMPDYVRDHNPEADHVDLGDGVGPVKHVSPWDSGTGSASCFCNPDTDVASTDVTCVAEEHTCAYTHLTHSTKPLFSVEDRGKWRGAKHSTCTGTSKHWSLRVTHPAATGLYGPNAQPMHTPVKMHRCKMVKVPVPLGMGGGDHHICRCCDCQPEAPAAFCWGPKAWGEIAYQGVGEGYGDMASAAAAFRNEKCLRKPGYDAAACRAECDKRGADCEAIQMKGKTGCTIALKGCMNQGCAEQLPLGSNPYKNGCYHTPTALDATASWRRRRGGGVGWAGRQQIAQLTGVENTFVQKRTPSNGHLCNGQDGQNALHISRGDVTANSALMGFHVADKGQARR
jgi:hypothetical protein